MIDPTRNAFIALVGGVVIFGLFLAPILMIQLRRYGQLSFRRLLGAIAVAIYGVAFVAYTLFPLPPRTDAVCPPIVQLVPFQFVADIARETAGMTLLSALTSAVVLQCVFNVVLFLPLGVIVRRYFSRGVLVATVAGLLVSGLIEATQYTGIWGIYGCAFRLADVDDLIFNTSGALIGALIAPLVLWWMPGESELVPKRLQPRPVTVIRRWVGMFLDWVAYGFVSAIAGVLFVGVPLVLGLDLPVWVDVLITSLLPGIVVFLIPALVRSGATFGQRVAWLEPAWSETEPSLGRRLSRAAVPIVWTALVTVGALDPDGTLGALMTFGAGVLVVAELTVVAASRGRGIATIASGAHFIDARSKISGSSEAKRLPSEDAV